MTNLHINQNPAIASPAMGPAQAFGGTNNSSSNGPSNSKAIAQTVEESLNDPQLASHPTTWDIDQVAYWLRWCGYGNVVPSFVGKWLVISYPTSIRPRFLLFETKLILQISFQQTTRFPAQFSWSST